MAAVKSLLFFLLLLDHDFAVLRAASAAFRPPDDILINCGGDATVSLGDGRVFRPDDHCGACAGATSPSLLSLASHSAVVRANSSSLYGSARVFTARSQYRLRIAEKGRHFLRLHFYPLAGGAYDLRSALFSVTADRFTLLHNFSYSKPSAGSPVLLKEYVVEAGFGSAPLILTVSPSDGSVGFVNAIEVLSIPDSVIPWAAFPVPPVTGFSISSGIAFEVVYRVNAGGPALSSGNDTLWRTWETDRAFLVNSASAHNVSTRPELIRYHGNVSIYTAPSAVYATADEMADANVGNPKFNISWVFKVDSGFDYLVRLHFCDFISESVRDLLFNVYINNQSVLSSLDVSNRVGLSSAYVVDFVVDVQMDSDVILVQVGPSELASILPNAILNGVEIMKLCNSMGSFDMTHTMNAISVQVVKKRKRVLLLTTSCLGGAVLVFVIAAMLLLYLRHRRRSKKSVLNWFPSPATLTTHMGHSETKVSAQSFASSGPFLGLGQLLAFSEIQEATKNFDQSLVIGVGGFGKVYKGVLENGIVVAVKRGNPRSQQGLTEFRTEIEMLSKLRHRHLVSLVGYCHEGNEMVLVYEFMAGGPLRKHLYGSDLPPLSWKQRLEICIGAAKGLHYLHTGAAETIIHRDVKTTNILLDGNLTAKVADFGLSKMGPSLDQTHVSTAVKGSFGYLDPEYFRRQRLTEKSDVYSFGVVMLEVLCARPAINPALPRDQVNIVEWAMNWQKRGQLERIIDPHLTGTLSLDSLRKFGGTAEKCLAEHGCERPTMGDVLWNLEYALQLQETFTRVVGEGSSTNTIQELPDWIPQLESIGHDSFSIVSDGTDIASSRVFSQLLDPKGR